MMMPKQGDDVSNIIVPSSEIISGKPSNIKCKNVVKREIDAPLTHRKSERRKFARDIFLVFEEQPSSRRVKGSNKKQGRQKSKFGHLNVEDPNKAKCLLRDIKNEPKSYTSEPSQNSVRKSLKDSEPIEQQVSIPQSNTEIVKDNQNNQPAKVNPIFLWVKQDDTRIVEVRCEDYDKRNRIRITKTTNGWKAIPRTDPASSRIVKFIQAPLLKIKREFDNQEIEGNTKLDDKQNVDIGLYESNDRQLDCHAEIQDKSVQHKSKKAKKKKKNKKLENKKKREKCKFNKPLKLSIDEEIEQEQEKLEETESYQHCLTPQNCSSTKEVLRKNNEVVKTYQEDLPKLQLCPKTGLFLPHNSDNVEDSNSSSTNVLVDFINSEIDCNKNNETNIAENLDAETKNLKDLLDDDDLLQHCGDNGNSDADLIDSLVKRSCENNLIQENDVIREASTANTYIGEPQDNETVVVETMPQIIETVTDPPKCLSFNEAGEIEGLNGELFQSSNYIETFEKDDIRDIQIDALQSENTDIGLHSPLSQNKSESNALFENTPKDLSYKKREEVCPPSESRSQCVVTSSSDVVKSPNRDDIPAIETTSDTIKNMILEQFIKLNSFNTGKQQSEPIDLGKQQQSPNESSAKSCPASSNYIETVVLDETDDEPVKKRLRNSVKNNGNIKENMSSIDKDPDPLTQLQLLIRNTQWKVPDPILVPKDRLGAVLASPAREIPLLITTRPELRLPEAFAYPEIIQNPNILVISMAQLEAILKNENHIEKPQLQTNLNEFTPDNTKKLNVQQQEPNILQKEPKTLQPKELSTKCSLADSGLATDINAATLAVLNQMFWIPYFNQISHEFLKSVKEPIGVQNKFNNLLPLLHQQLGMQHLDELYKSFVNQISGLKQMNTEASTQNFGNCIGGFKNPMELAIFQKIVQHQMHNILNTSVDPLVQEKSQKDMPKQQHASSEHSSNAAHNNILDAKRCKKSIIENNPLPSFHLSDRNGNVTITPTYKTSCENTNAVADSSISHNVNSNKNDTNNKPRLTCKSLSNLLEPENVSSIISLANYGESVNKSTEKSKDAHAEGTFRSAKTNANYLNINSNELSKQRKRNFNIMDAVTSEVNGRNSDTVNTDTNPALWHPLFGSNAKTGYSSPWQWTTVTATGE
ncbi:uncharacterized protein LOC119670069 [Teleopsis dalmanni]|uniref:uncharacterized protein LOC119670069 n=1 Tax=Teleopsis dalmanni TaxID=139649 RepID=UPI0018CF9890|nr:uncharacterized protein LOC119670069 [Teleopsis dalmanni]